MKMAQNDGTNRPGFFGHPPRAAGRGRWAVWGAVTLGAVVLGALLVGSRWQAGALEVPLGRTARAASDAAQGTYYTCAMHPTVVAEEPGTCPICGMDLVKKTVSTAPANRVAANRKAPAPCLNI